MKKGILTPLLLISMITVAGAQEKFIVKARLTDLPHPAKVFLTFTENGAHIRDSVVTTNGEFSFSGTVLIPTRGYIDVKAAVPDTTTGVKKSTMYDGQEFFLEKGVIRITGINARTAVITGGKAQSEFTAYNRLIQPFKDQQAALMPKIMVWSGQAVDTTGAAAVRAQYNEVGKAMSNAKDDFIRTHPNSYVSLHLLQSTANYMHPPTFGPLYDGLSASVKNSEAGRQLGERLNIARKTAIGNPAINFTQNTKEGMPFTLNSLKGKYVLVDFWASWCGPCRAENPYVLKAYHTFKNKNFEVVSVSLDEKREPWLHAIEKDSLPWIHVSDLKGWMNEVAVAYGIRAIPRNILVSPDGIIVAKNLRGEEVAVKLAELIK